MTEPNELYEDDAYRYFKEAYEKQTKGQVEEAIELYRKSLEILPTAEAFTFLGWAYSFQGRYEEAIEECRRAIDIDPDYGNPYNDIGSYLIELSRFEEAIPWLEKATRAERYDAYCYPYFNLGKVYEKKGDWMRALVNYRKALEFKSDYKLAQQGSHRIQAYLN